MSGGMSRGAPVCRAAPSQEGTLVSIRGGASVLPSRGGPGRTRAPVRGAVVASPASSPRGAVTSITRLTTPPGGGGRASASGTTATATATTDSTAAGIAAATRARRRGIGAPSTSITATPSRSRAPASRPDGGVRPGARTSRTSSPGRITRGATASSAVAVAEPSGDTR